MALERIPHASRDAAEAACAAWLGDSLAAALAATAAPGGRVTLMLSGGSTPGRVLPPLLARDIAWNRVDVLASDERVVPSDHPDSTEGLVRRLFADAGRPLHYAGPGGETDPDTALAAWRQARAGIAWPPCTGLIGIGDDAHTASLFPGRPETLDETLQDAAVPETAPHRHPRLTLGLAALAAAPALALVAADPGKAAALDRTLAAPGDWPLGRRAARTRLRVFADGPTGG